MAPFQPGVTILRLLASYHCRNPNRDGKEDSERWVLLYKPHFPRLALRARTSFGGSKEPEGDMGPLRKKHSATGRLWKLTGYGLSDGKLVPRRLVHLPTAIPQPLENAPQTPRLPTAPTAATTS